jgi:hypothetical protein
MASGSLAISAAPNASTQLTPPFQSGNREMREVIKFVIRKITAVQYKTILGVESRSEQRRLSSERRGLIPHRMSSTTYINRI